MIINMSLNIIALNYLKDEKVLKIFIVDFYIFEQCDKNSKNIN